MHKYLYLGALAVVLLLAGCGSSDLGNILGGSTTGTAVSEVRGVVDSIDLNSRSILLTNARTYSSSLADGGLSGGGNTARIYFDNNTTVTYQGRNYRPEDLERGDEISARVDESGGRLIATSMTVVYDVSGTGTTAGTYGSTLRGTVRYIDTGRRTIEFDRGSSLMTVQYDANTDVMFGGRTYRPEELERGDEIEVVVRDLGSGRLLAQDITVIRSMSGTTTGTAATALRGTVRFVDVNQRTIELEQANWISRFNTGTGIGSTVVVRYDANTPVEFGGRVYAATNLERGDVVEVQVRNLGGGSLFADRIIVIRDVNTSF